MTRRWGCRLAFRASHSRREIVLYLVLQLANDRYAIEVAHIEEIIPLVHIRELPGAPAGVAGLIDYYGEPVPVCDLGEIALGKPTASRMAARIVIARDANDNGSRRLIGLLVPRATDVLRCEPTDFVPPGVQLPDAPCLGNVHVDAHGIVQLVRVDQLLTPAIRQALTGALDAV
jgi:chemotaxis-related protein WspB